MMGGAGASAGAGTAKVSQPQQKRIAWMAQKLVNTASVLRAAGKPFDLKESPTSSAESDEYERGLTLLPAAPPPFETWGEVKKIPESESRAVPPARVKQHLVFTPYLKKRIEVADPRGGGALLKDAGSMKHSEIFSAQILHGKLSPHQGKALPEEVIDIENPRG